MSRSAGRSRRFPWLNLPFLVVIVLLVGYGLTIVYSAVRVDADYQYSRQIGGVAVGVICMILMWRFDYRRLSEYTTLFLIVNVVLILSPHIPGLGTDAGMGAKSWIKLGMQIQPGEFAKVTVTPSACSAKPMASMPPTSTSAVMMAVPPTAVCQNGI